MNFSTQVHDFDPGITPYPDGLFWTVPLPAGSVDVEFGAGKATMEADNLSAPDFFNIPNALFRFMSPASKPATCSFEIEWSGPVTSRSNIKDPDVGFAGEFVFSQANMTWSAARSDGFTFVSDPSGTVSAFAQLCHMRNGVFFGS
jgi:hypothetical protein